ncbi:MAG: hypothetical protein K9L74_01280 [Candidatus Izimaplasma sp.]|nr:hypothetical protein [Candidatus Izimaplasma bacterium]
MKTKKLGIALLVMLALVVTTGTFAYWASSVTDGTNTVGGTVTVGTGEQVTTTVTVTAQSDLNGNLVPVGFEDATKVNNLDLTFPVTWTADQAGADGIVGNLNVTISNYAIGTLTGTAVTDMFTVTITSGSGAITEGVSQNVIINVEFTNEPTDSTTYSQVAGNDLTFDVTFTASAN